MIVSTVRRTLRDRALVEAGDHVLVACSGGPDSTVLLHALNRLRRDFGITLCAASIDHGLREESATEVTQVGAFAESLGIPFRSLRIHLASDGPSLQSRAREVRYEALQTLAAESKATRVAVGHTQDDQAETVLARILRGAGLRGLGGIQPRRVDRVIRPLFDCRRSDVHRYAKERGLPFLIDPSNDEPAFERVRLRHEILPRLSQEDPKVVEHLCALADQARAYEGLLEAHLPSLPQSGQLSLQIELVAQLAPATQVQWLRRWLEQETGVAPGRSHLTQVGKLLTASGEVLLGSGWAVRRDGDALLLEYREKRRTRSTR